MHNAMKGKLKTFRFSWLLGIVIMLAALLPAGADEGLRVATLPLTPVQILRDLAGAWVGANGQKASVTVCNGWDSLAAAVKSGKADVVMGTCTSSAQKLVEDGLVIPETKKVIFYRRLAILLPPGDPGQIMSAADLDRQGLRIGLFSIHTVGPLVEKIKPNATVISTDQHLLLDLLEQGRLDAVVTWDCFLEIRPNLVTMRLPRSVAGDGASMEVPAFVAKGTERRRDAEAFIDYCAESPEAHRILLSNAVMLQDGSRAEEYDTGAAVKFAKVYENIDRQIVDDYGISKGTCIDVGCGPGQMDLMLAKMTDLKIVGVDIEPEAIDVARKNALDAGLSDRVNFVCADAHSLPFANESADLIISRGTLPFLRDQVLAFREVYRVLKPGGVAFLGGGMGRYTLPEEAEKLYPRGTGPKTAMGLGPGQKPEESMFPFPVGDMNVLMTRAGIPNYKVITEGGRWVEIRK